MKRMLQTLCVFALVLLCLLPVVASDASAANAKYPTGKCGDDITWTLVNGTLTLTGSGAMYDYDFDYGTSYNYLKAKAPWAQYTPQISAVKADVSITHIGNMAFFQCTHLKSVDLPGVLTIGSQAFQGCSALGAVSLPETVTIEKQAFYGCSSLATLDADEVVSLAENAFAKTRIQKLSLPDVKSLSQRAFAGCTYLTDVSLPEAESIGSGAFDGCTHLVTVIAPKLKVVPAKAFYGCSALVNVDITGAKGIGEQSFAFCKSLTSIELKEATSIGREAFSGCTALQSASAAKLLTLNSNVFKNCTALTSVELPAVTSIGSYAFSGCTALKHISMPSLPALPAHAFEGLKALTTVNLPKVIAMGEYAFNACPALQSIYLPELTTTKGHSFRSCSALTVADLPKLTAIAKNDFYQCTSLKEINAAQVTTIGDFAFQECSALKTIDFPKATYIGNCGFYLCSALTDAYIPSVKTIYLNGFNKCASLSMLNISYDLERVHERAFEGCKSLKQVYVTPTKSKWSPLQVDQLNNDYFLAAKMITDSAPLTVSELPKLLSVTEGSNAVLQVTARGSGCSYQWQFYLPGSDRWVDLSPTSTPTAISAKLMYGPVTMNDSGIKFRCVVTDRSGNSLTTNEALLKVTPFSDVAGDAYYYDAVLWAVENNITAGIADKIFGSDAPCTRAQVVTFLWAAADRPTPESTELPFTDVADDAYYRNAVLWAVEQGITSGTSPTTFGPDVTCTRAQIATMMWKAYGDVASVVIPDIPIEKAAAPFTDVDASDWYYQAVLWAVEEGITAGTSPTTFGPNNPCTRAQIVTFLYKANS